MNKTQKVMRPPLPKGYMHGYSALSKSTTKVPFAWPSTKYICPGYTLRGVKHECGIVFESTTGTVQRCQKCRPIHTREYHRLRKQRNRLYGKSLS